MKQKLLRDCKISISTPLANSLLLFAVVAPAHRAWLLVDSRAVVRRCPACGLDTGGDDFPVHFSATFSDTFQTSKTALMCRACFDGLPDVTEQISVELAHKWLDAKADFERRFRERYPNLRVARF